MSLIKWGSLIFFFFQFHDFLLFNGQLRLEHAVAKCELSSGQQQQLIGDTFSEASMFTGSYHVSDLTVCAHLAFDT